MTDTELYQRCKDEWEMQVEIFRSIYAKGHNDAKRDIALSGEYERAYQRGRDSVIAVLDKIRTEIDEQYDRVHPYNISCAEGLEMALDIIDKYKAETE